MRFGKKKKTTRIPPDFDGMCYTKVGIDNIYLKTSHSVTECNDLIRGKYKKKSIKGTVSFLFFFLHSYFCYPLSFGLLLLTFYNLFLFVIRWFIGSLLLLLGLLLLFIIWNLVSVACRSLFSAWCLMLGA